EVDAAGGFGGQGTADSLDGGAQAGDVHVVEQDHVGAGGERRVDFGEIAALNFDLQGVRRAGARRGDRVRDAAGGGDVVVLDQNAVVEAAAVIVTTAGAHRVLLERAEAGSRLARV